MYTHLIIGANLNKLVCLIKYNNLHATDLFFGTGTQPSIKVKKHHVLYKCVFYSMD